ncbi:RagB/SusD family nutrient uptake outer membrane protein [Algibacter mikhailovii]|uniref:Membrane protein n=1 Tax=Algibacter mikhailovii TaxID=425498 RepID=A0A918R0V2_9FLAO|nr:RagB/SusD family nutrient uptake outer membrane protein [Algibacter mikhailovii]GGZ81790.1 membrane protein [Algibacter mikhailovii]
MMIFKNYKIKSAICLSMIITLFSFSCADLEEDPGQSQLSPQALTNVEALRGVIAATYRVAFNAVRWSEFHLAAYGGDDITTESSVTSGNKEDFRDSDWRTQTDGVDRVIKAYLESYRIIANANVAINAQENIVDGDKDEIDRLLGEAYFLRAYAYMHLTRTYGRVPIVTTLGSVEQPAKASFDEIYTLMENDLLKAEALLPDTYPGIVATGTRPSKGAAKAFLARLYMHWAGFPINDNSKYALAAEKAGEVVNGDYGYALASSIKSMWTIDGRFAHDEGVFTFVACLTCMDNLGNRTVGRLGLPAEAGGWTETFGEIAYYEDMEAAAITDGTQSRFEDTYVHERILRGSGPYGSDWREWIDPHPVLRKVAGSESTVWNSTNADINRYVMRYADVLLMYAEASGRSGNVTADSWKALNEVRRRAGATVDLTSADGPIEELAYTERKWELCGEYERWHDLVRMQRFTDPNHVRRSSIEPVDVVNNRTPADSGEYLYFTPIPRGAKDVNPNL